jgi:sirohydrochlorin cobaltochelatase
MPESIEEALAAALTGSCQIGQILIQQSHDGFVLLHREDEQNADVREYSNAEDAIEIARYDDLQNYRPLKTAPNLRHGWRLKVADFSKLLRALDYFYPGRLAMVAARRQKRLVTTPLRETLERQSGMYRIAATISDDQLDEVVGNFCPSDGGCLRTILWKRNQSGAVPSMKLPLEKFDPSHDQAKRPGSASSAAVIPLLCQEACNLLVAECRKAVKGE